MEKGIVHIKEIKANAEKRKKLLKNRRQELINSFKEVKESLGGKRKLRSFEQILRELNR